MDILGGLIEKMPWMVNKNPAQVMPPEVSLKNPAGEINPGPVMEEKGGLMDFLKNLDVNASFHYGGQDAQRAVMEDMFRQGRERAARDKERREQLYAQTKKREQAERLRDFMEDYGDYWDSGRFAPDGSNHGQIMAEIYSRHPDVPFQHMQLVDRLYWDGISKMRDDQEAAMAEWLARPEGGGMYLRDYPPEVQGAYKQKYGDNLAGGLIPGTIAKPYPGTEEPGIYFPTDLDREIAKQEALKEKGLGKYYQKPEAPEEPEVKGWGDWLRVYPELTKIDPNSRMKILVAIENNEPLSIIQNAIKQAIAAIPPEADSDKDTPLGW